MRRRAGAAAALLTLSVGGYAAWSAAADAQPSYRTTTVALGDVQETLDLTGTVGSVGRSDLAFGTDGSVQRVAVAVGDRVEAGQVIARLDPVDLAAAVTRAHADVAAARAQLESDTDAQAETVSAAATATSTPTTSSPSSPATQQTQAPTQATDEPTQQAPTDPAVTDALATLAAQQSAVTSAQTDAGTALDAANAALDAQTAACATAFAEPEPTETPTDSPTDTPTDTPTEVPADDTACTEALASVQAAQTSVSEQQDTLQAALTALADTLTTAVEALAQQQTPTTQGDTQTQTQAQTQQPTTQSTTPSTQTSTQTTPSAGPSTTVTAATLARDQASIDEALATLVAARQALAGAVVRAPASGTVVSLDLAQGDAVTAGTDVVVVLSGGVTQVVTTATTDQVRSLEVGQTASVVPAGGDAQPATVTAVAIAPTTDTAGTSSYAVTVTLDERGLDLAEGVTASVAVVVDEADDVVAVPLSAVSSSTVRVLGTDGTVGSTRVTTGLVGATTVEVTDGLAVGDQVVLADLGQELPTGDTTQTTTGGFGGGFGGGTGGPPAGGGPGRG